MEPTMSIAYHRASIISVLAVGWISASCMNTSEEASSIPSGNGENGEIDGGDVGGDSDSNSVTDAAPMTDVDGGEDAGEDCAFESGFPPECVEKVGFNPCSEDENCCLGSICGDQLISNPYEFEQQICHPNCGRTAEGEPCCPNGYACAEVPGHSSGVAACLREGRIRVGAFEFVTTQENDESNADNVTRFDTDVLIDESNWAPQATGASKERGGSFEFVFQWILGIGGRIKILVISVPKGMLESGTLHWHGEGEDNGFDVSFYSGTPSGNTLSPIYLEGYATGGDIEIVTVGEVCNGGDCTRTTGALSLDFLMYEAMLPESSYPN